MTRTVWFTQWLTTYNGYKRDKFCGECVRKYEVEPAEYVGGGLMRCISCSRDGTHLVPLGELVPIGVWEDD